MSKQFNAPRTSTKENSEELYFTWYLDELKEAGYIEHYDRESETMEVLPAFNHKRMKIFKSKKPTYESFAMLQPINYTYDYRIIWSPEKALYLFTEVYSKDDPFVFGQPLFVSHWININGETKMVSYVDVKPHSSVVQFGRGTNSSFYTFPLIQKFLMYRYGIFINKAIPVNNGKHGRTTCLFAVSFTPNRYLYTDSAQQLRKIPFKKTSFRTFISKRAGVIDTVLADMRRNSQGDNQTKLL